MKIKPDSFVKQLVAVTFPDYRGRKFRIEAQTHPLDCKSYWEGGSRDYFAFVRLADMQSQDVPQQSAFDRDIQGLESVTLPEGIVCVERSYFCGKDIGITIHVNPLNMAKLLEEHTS